jgi:peptidoglycan/LPS O-acetylase OafA/YrhL
MADVAEAPEHRALERLRNLERRQAGPSMGYQPSLDGLRAISVLAVIVYHGGFTWISGGFFGVEVFFVVSGFLITSLLLDERTKSGFVDLKQFWIRRGRRLLPALFTMLFAVAVWTAIWGGAQQQSQLRRDLPWSLVYVANWGQILGDVPYFSGGDPPLLRHLWSLAVEEQWYLLWPLAFIALAAVRTSHRVKGWALVAVSFSVMALTAWLARAPELPPARVNFLYLSTITRSSGLLLGAGCAFLWRPWRSRTPAPIEVGRRLDIAGILAIVVLAFAAATGHVNDRATYRWMLPMVTVASAVAVLVAVHPGSTLVRRALSSRPLVVVGQRSYGLYLWTWPVTVVCGAYLGWDSWVEFLLAMAIAVPLSEACFRWIETPIRRGTFRIPSIRSSWALAAGCLAALVPLLAVFYSGVRPFDPAAGGADVAFALPVTPSPTSTAAATSGAAETAGDSAAMAGGAGTAAAIAPTTTAAPVATAPVLPRRVVIVGDSQAHSLAINLPSGIESTFAIRDGSVEGCGVYDTGKAVSSRAGFSRSFGDCAGWQDEWASAATQSDAELALVVIGAWEVFDMQVGDQSIPFASPQADQRFVDQVNVGIDALRATGAQVALLEVPCMRPQDVEGAGVPALPERGDDTRVAHLNDPLRQVAAE